MYIIKEATHNDVDLINKFFEISKQLYKNDRELSFNASGRKSCIWPKYKLFLNKKKTKKIGKTHECYNNSFVYAKENNLKLAGGFFIARDLFEEVLNSAVDNNYQYSYMMGGFCGPHAWNVDERGFIIDVTLDSSKYIYIGEVLDVNKFNSWEDVERDIVSKYNTGKQNKDWNKIDVYN